jgi:5-methylcytosine-specific restriction protein A
MHQALDRCTREHHTVPKLLNCIDAAGRLHLVNKMDDLLAAIASGTVGHRVTETMPEDPRPQTDQLLTRSRTAAGTRTANDFRVALKKLLDEAERSGQSYVDVLAGDLHRRVGGYPGKAHNMPGCVAVMKAEMQPGDEVVNAPPSGKGASVIIRYRLPRGSRKEAE